MGSNLEGAQGPSWSPRYSLTCLVASVNGQVQPPQAGRDRTQGADLHHAVSPK